MRVAAFDLDGTITDRDCVVPFLRRVAGTGPLTMGLLTRPVVIGGALLRRDRDQLKAAATQATFRGRDVAPVTSQAHEFARHVHANWLRPDAVARIESHRTDGDGIVIVSASFELYVEPLAARLGIDHVLATRLRVDAHGRFTGALDGPNCRGAEKVRRLHAWLDEFHGGRSVVDLVAYGDSAGDRELLADADTAHWAGSS
jgi:phosphatidylglycerophosphatase C